MSRRFVVAGGACTTLFGMSACKAAPPQEVSLLDFLPAPQHAKIAQGTSDFDCAPDLQRAVVQAAGAAAILRLPKGTYFLRPSHRLQHADRFECLAAVRMVTGMRLHGESETLLRMLPGFSTDQAPRAMAMFATTEPIADIEFDGLILDMYGRANPISPGRADGVYNRLPQAQIFVSGGRGKAAARIDRARIADTVFRDANGVSCIVMGQNEDPAATLGRDWTIDKCRFLDNGMDTDDHSCIFAYAENVATSNCSFANVVPFGPTGVNTAYEVHGSRQTISGCSFTNMMRGVWVANNYSSVTSGTTIADNTFRTIFYGVDFYNDRGTARVITDTRILGNRFAFDDLRIASVPRLDFKAAVQIASEFGQRDVKITGNSVVKIGRAVPSAFLVVTGGASGSQRHDLIEASANRGTGLTFGSFVRTTALAGLGRLTITRNQWTALARSPAMAITAGDVVEHTGTLQPVASLTLGGSTVTTNGRPATPIYINAWVRSLALEGIEGYGRATTPVKLGGSARVEAIERRTS